MTLAFLSLGSNVAPERHLPAAVTEIVLLGKLLAVSRVYETPPLVRAAQSRYCNGAVLLETASTAPALKEALLRIEERLGRVRQADRHASRPIDLDITLFGDAVLCLGQRDIPDPDLLTKAHVAVPLSELSPLHRHPQTGQTLAQIAGLTKTVGFHLRADLVLWPDSSRRPVCHL